MRIQKLQNGPWCIDTGLATYDGKTFIGAWLRFFWFKTLGKYLTYQHDTTRLGGSVHLIKWGSGAGYIGGWTMFLAFKSGSLDWLRNYRNGKLSAVYKPWEYIRLGNVEIGITRNSNVVPY